MVKTASLIPEFEGKTALITGASRGIGEAAVVALASAGVRHFVLHYNSHRQGIDELVKKLGDSVSCRVIQADLSNEAGIESFVGDLRKLDASVDFLINNAGFLVQRAKLAESTADLWDRVMNLNAKSAWFITQALVPGMIERGGGVIVNLSSGWGRSADAEVAPYCASKWAIRG